VLLFSLLILGANETLPPRMIFRGVARERGSRRRPGRDGGAEEVVLDGVELVFEVDDVELVVLSAQSSLDLIGDCRMGKDSVIGSLWSVIATREVAAPADFLGQLHDGLEEVGVEPEDVIEGRQHGELFGSVIAIVPDGLADDGVVLLLDVAVVVFVIGPAAGKGDLLLETVPVELIIDELTAVVRVQAEQPEGEVALDLLESVEDIGLGLIFQGFHLHPCRGDIGEGEGLGVLAKACSPVVGNEVRFAEAWTCVVPVGEGPDGDMVFEQRPGTRARSTLQTRLRPGRGQEPVNGGRTDGEQQLAEAALGEGECSLAFQQGEHLTDEGDEPFATQAVGEGPELPQGCEEGFPAVLPPPATLCPRSAAVPRDEHDSSGSAVKDLELSLPARAEHKGSVTARVPGQTDELIQDLASFAFGCLLEARSQFSDIRMTFLHREPHGQGPPDRHPKVRFYPQIWNRTLHEATAPFRIDFW